jgi:hypothetical protein
MVFVVVFFTRLASLFIVQMYGMCTGLQKQLFLGLSPILIIIWGRSFMHRRCGRFIIMPSSSLSDVLDNDSIDNEQTSRDDAVLIETVVLTSLTSYHANASASHLLKKERIKVRRENSQLLPADSRKLIDRNEITHKRVTKEHILSLLGAGLLQGNPAEVESLFAKRYGFVESIKTDLRHFASMQIRHLMLELAVDRKMLFDRELSIPSGTYSNPGSLGILHHSNARQSST